MQNVGRVHFEKQRENTQFLSHSSCPLRSWEICEYSPISLFPLAIFFNHTHFSSSQFCQSAFPWFWFWWVFLEIRHHNRKTHLVFSLILDKRGNLICETMGISHQIMPACDQLCVCCPAMRTRSRQPVKRYKKLISDSFPRSPVRLILWYWMNLSVFNLSFLYLLLFGCFWFP